MRGLQAVNQPQSHRRKIKTLTDYKNILKNNLVKKPPGKKPSTKKQETKKETLPPGRRFIDTGNDDQDDNQDDSNTLQDQKTKEEVRKLKILNEKELKNLFLMKLFDSIMGEISHSVQVNFVDISRRDSARLAAEWGIPNQERQIEKDISDIIATGIESFCSDIENLMDDGVFD